MEVLKCVVSLPLMQELLLLSLVAEECSNMNPVSNVSSPSGLATAQVGVLCALGQPLELLKTTFTPSPNLQCFGLRLHLFLLGP